MNTETAQTAIAAMFDDANKKEFLISWAGFATCLHEEPAFSFDAPLLVMAGEQDTRGTILKHICDWEHFYPGCTVDAIPNAGHVANLDNPEPFNDRILSFLNDLSNQITGARK